MSKEIGQVLKEEGATIGMNLRSIETGGLSLSRQLVKADLKLGEPCGRPECALDVVNGGVGRPHNRGTCNVCEEKEMVSKYWGKISTPHVPQTLRGGGEEG